jgi:hypothetical protein
LRRARIAAIAVALLAGASGTAGAQSASPALKGTFAMRGRLTRVVHVFGEHVGQRVRRSWTFVPQCQTASCPTVLLKRERSGQHIIDTITLSRTPSGVYVGHGRFFIPLRCAGQLVVNGGVAAEKITVRIVRTTTVGTTTFASAIKATYRNPWRKNLTRCPGGIGHDAARYSGQLVSGVP